MKRHLSLLALGLCGMGLVKAQTTTNTSSITTTNTTYTSPVTTDSTNAVPASNGTTPATATMGNGTVNGAAPTVYSTTTTTTTTTDYDANRNTGRGKDGRAWGKSGKFGIYAGINASQFVGEFADNRTSQGRVGYQVGLYGRSGGTVFGQIGAEFRRSSSNLQQTGNGQSLQALEDQIDQTFLAVPAYVGLRVGSALGLRLQAGAELAALVAIGDNNFQLGEDDLNRTILNGLLGVGINLGPLTLDAVYNRGLQNVFDDGADTKRRILALNVGLRF